MKYFIFRNNTIETLFPGSEYEFSGYDDISYIPQTVDGYIWFYQVPIKFNNRSLCDEVNGFADKLQLVLKRIPSDKPLILFNLVDIYSIKYTDSDYSLQQAIRNFNDIANDLSSCHDNVKLIDFESFTCMYAKQDLIDWRFYFISQMAFNPKASTDFKSWFAKKLDSIALKRKKCLVLDLDNTLWGGILGEDGSDGIKIGGDYPGKAFLYFQEALIQLAENGVILTVCSKNNEHDVIDAWNNNPYIKLKQGHIAAYRINWNNKADNIQELANELNIGLDSMVFIDDNPVERDLVKKQLPMVETPEFPSQPYNLPIFIKDLVDNYFKIYTITAEDRSKTEQYKSNAARAQDQHQYTDISDYIKSLETVITISEVNEYNIQRIAQMTQKTNQFNLTTHRYTDIEIKQLADKGWKIWCMSVKDKYGDNGITGCIIMNGEHIDSLMLSCRVLGRGIEYAFVRSILSILKDKGRRIISATYIPSAKNSQVATFYDKCGFKQIEESEDGSKTYDLDLTHIEIKPEVDYKIIIK